MSVGGWDGERWVSREWGGGEREKVTDRERELVCRGVLR